MLISFESEVNTIRNQYGKDDYEVVVPKTDILAEFPVAWVDKNVEHNKTADAAKAYLTWLYSPEAQKIITDFYYRVNNPQLMEQQKIAFQPHSCFGLKTYLVAGITL